MMQEMPESKGKKPAAATPPASPNPGIMRRLKNLDIYPKIDESYRVQTSGGALLSIIGWLLIAALTIMEINNYLTPKFKEHMVVDTSLGQQLKININVTFHALTCNEAHLDAMDVAGDNQLNVEHEMIKQRLSKDGVPIGKAGIEIIGEGPLIVEELPKDYCGDCYGADSDDIKCCNTCNELIQAYQRKQWSVNEILRNSTQCLHDRAKHFASVGADEGCMVSGTMSVNKVAGNFHIAHGESIVRDGRHIHQFNPALAPKFNVSHTIHSVSFGEKYPSMPANPLDGASKIIGADENTGLYQYFVRVIPTIYTNEYGYKHYTNQYTITDRFRPLTIPKAPSNGLPGNVEKPQEAVLPGIFFVYELSPFMIEASRNRIPLLHLFTKICAIVGGVFTVLGVIDSILFRLQKMASTKRN
mmetsp:Transcript_16272/g.27496  ORF Transcript_16272/g.27496 Transcript_16272/m.27496 type:complete len:415 (-) Transcript_16272:109-1353(-)